MHNRSSLSQMNAELPCSTRSNPTIRDMSFPIPNPPLNWEINCSPSSRFFFFTSKNDMSEHPVRFQCLWLGWLKALQPETSCRVDPTEKAKFRRDNRNLFFFLLFSVECTGITAAQRHALLSCGWLCCVDVWTCVSVTSHYKETPLWCVFWSNDLFMCWLNRPASHLLYDI